MVLLAACGGGTQWDSAQTAPAVKSTPKRAAQSVAPAAATTAAERPYVDALSASAAASGTELSATTSRCLAAALVHGFGVAAFSSNGITPNALRGANSNLDALPDPTDQQITTIGAALQRCRIGHDLAVGLAQGLRITDAASINCFTTQFNSSAIARRFVIIAMLNRKVDLETAHDAVGVIAACVDLPTWVLRTLDVPVDATTRSCLVNALRNSDATLKDYMALRISGADPDTAIQASEALAVATNQCRPSARTGFTVPSD